jgi:DNA-binding SARP family transcriptional activator
VSIAPLRVHLLGGLEVEGVDSRELGSRKARTLLKLLALARGAPVPAERLAEELWGDHQPARPRDQVGVLVSRLRSLLGTERITRNDVGYALHADWLDVEELEARVEEAAARLAAGQPTSARATAKAALDLARGPLLPEEDAEWIDLERAAADRLLAQARMVGAEAALRAGDRQGASALAEAILDRDPYDERRCGCSCGATSPPAGLLRLWPPTPGPATGWQRTSEQALRQRRKPFTQAFCSKR